jgi:tRNA G10  N-methylase Trm11
MINLVNLGNPNVTKIYDPFCGMGSIVGEAYCLGFETWGSDIDPQCVRQTKDNMEWLSRKKKYHSQNSLFPLDHIFRMDITAPNKNFSQKYNGSLVAEPNLLSPLKDYPTAHIAKQMMIEFENNYFSYFQGINQILKSGQIGVLIFPRIHTNQNNRVVFNYRELLANFNCSIVEFEVKNIYIPAVFIHAWKKHIIEREIVVFQKD